LQILQLAESGREDGTGLCRQRIELLGWAQLSCRSQLTFAITIDKSGANRAAIFSYNADHDTDVEVRQVKDLNNIVVQDHRAIK
jgi:hypothetical protein